MLVSTADLAKILGISRQRVNELGRLGKITRAAGGLWDPDQVKRQLGRNLNADQQPRAKVDQKSAGSESGPTDPDLGGRSSHEIFNRARAAKELAIAKTMQLDLKAREGQLIELDDVKHTWGSLFIRFKNSLLYISGRLARKVAPCPDEDECRQLVEDELMALLDILSETKFDDAA